MESVVTSIGERPTLESVYRTDGDRLWRAIRAYAADPEIASDAVAEAFAQALRRGDAVRDPAAWVWRAAFRIAAGQLEQRRARGDADLEVAAGIVDPADRGADPDLLAALRRLPDGQRAAVVLHYYADLPVRDIAARLGSNGLAVRANLSRGRRRLRELLEAGDD